VDSRGPIRSLLADDESLAHLDQFVLGLGERIDGLQDAEQQGALDDAAKQALELAREATRFGLPPLASAAEQVAGLCRAGDPRAALEAIVELTDVVTRVRLGHRGSAL
jgi:hypothetical protein